MHLSSSSVVSLCIAVCLLATVCHADRPIGPSGKPVDPAKGGRTLQRMSMNTHGGHNLMFDSTSATGQVVRFKFTTDGFPRFRLAYFSTVADATNPGTVDLSVYRFRWGFLRLVEFNDTGRVQGRWDSNDTVVNSYRLTGLTHAWSNIIQWTSLSDNNSTVYHWNTYVDVDSHGSTICTLNITFHFTTASTVDNQTHYALEPDMLKFDIDVLNYQYAAPADSLAFIGYISSSDKIQAFNVSTDTGAVAVGSTGSFRFVRTLQTGPSSNSSSQRTRMGADSLEDTDGAAAGITGNAGPGGFDDDVAGESYHLHAISLPINRTERYIRWDPDVSMFYTVSPASHLSVPTFLAAALAVLCAFFSTL